MYTGTVEGLSKPEDGGTHDIRYDDEPDKEAISDQLVGGETEKWELLDHDSKEVLV